MVVFLFNIDKMIIKGITMEEIIDLYDKHLQKIKQNLGLEEKHCQRKIVI